MNFLLEGNRLEQRKVMERFFQRLEQLERLRCWGIP
jgi:hypothetical protein